MNLEQHERMILQMLTEVRGVGIIATGKPQHYDFLMKNEMVKKTQLFEANGSKSGRIRYRLTPHGEGMLRHLINKYKEELSNDGIENGSGRTVGQPSEQGDAGCAEDDAPGRRDESTGDVSGR